MSAFDEFCLLGLLKHWRTWKWMKLCNSGDQIWLKKEVHTGALEALQLKKGLEKNQLNKLTISHLLPQHLNITVAVMLSLAETIKHLKNRQNSMLFYVKSMRFKSQQVHTSKSSTIEDGPQECHDKEGSRERFGVFLRLVLPICATSLDCTGASWSEV